MNLTMKRMEAKRTVRLAAVAASVLLGVAACGTAMALHFEVKAGSAATKAGDNQGPSKHAEVTAGELMGQVVSRQMPVYPAKAKADKSIVNGPVVIGMTVDTDGVPTDLHLLKSLRSDYDESALTAVKAWRYKPYLLNGEPVAVDTVVTITYNAPRD